MREVFVALKERAYKIHIKPGLSRDILPLLKEFISGKKCLVVTDSNVSKIYGEKIVDLLKTAAKSVSIFEFEAGEDSKNLSTVGEIYKKALSSGLNRSSYIIALGGGVPGDIAGFAAATYMRGISYIQIPTTLLAMVDSSVGGKTGVDLAEGKNLIGAFWQPKIVLVDPDALKTLPEREIRCGLAEVVKYGVIMDPDFFEMLEVNSSKILKLDSQCLTEIIAHCCRLKAEIVVNDEREEKGLRAILNFGHTFGHALETVTNYSAYAHGEAVSVGMCLAAKFAVHKGIFDRDSSERLKLLLKTFGLPCERKDLPSADILKVMTKDKKAVNGDIRLVLPEKIGKVSVVKVSAKEVKNFMDACP